MKHVISVEYLFGTILLKSIWGNLCYYLTVIVLDTGYIYRYLYGVGGNETLPFLSENFTTNISILSITH